MSGIPESVNDSRGWVDLVELDDHGTDLTQFEIDFVESVMGQLLRGRFLSRKQRDLLNRIREDRLRAIRRIRRISIGRRSESLDGIDKRSVVSQGTGPLTTTAEVSRVTCLSARARAVQCTHSRSGSRVGIERSRWGSKDGDRHERVEEDRTLFRR